MHRSRLFSWILVVFIALTPIVAALSPRVDEGRLSLGSHAAAQGTGPGLLISKVLTNPGGSGASGPRQWVELIATRAIDFAETPYTVIGANNGSATADGWVASGSLTLAFAITAGRVVTGEVVYVGGPDKAGFSAGAPGRRLRIIDVGTSSGDRFGFGSFSNIGQGGPNADGVAVFAAPTHVITPGTVPIDAIFFGTGMGLAVVSGGSAGYQLPVNDNYSGGKLQTSSFLAPDSASGQALRATGTFNLATGTFSTPRTWANGVFDIGRSGVTLASAGNAHPQLACQSPVFIQAGSSGSAVITARDTDGTISNVASIVGTTYPGLPTITPFASASVITTTLVAPPTTQQGVYTATLQFQNTDSTPVTVTCTVELVVGPAPDATGRIFIGGVQGPGHVSPFFGTGRAITGTNFISGVITARFGNGFWVQDPTDSNDGNDLTSDGIFVFTGSPTPVTATVGTRVQVQGYVSEFRARTDGLQITQITSRSSSSIAATRVITYLSTGNPLPTPIVIGAGGRTPPNQFIDGVSQGGLLEYRTRPFDPTTRGIDFYEALEGMLVQVNDPVVVGATNGFGEVWVLGDDGGPVGPNAVRMARGGIGIGPGNFNPQRLLIDDEVIKLLSSPPNPPMPQVAVGDRLGAVGATNVLTGVVDYGFSNYRIQATAPLTRTIIGSSLVTGTIPQSTIAASFAFTDPAIVAARETTTLTSGPNHLTIASYNIFNLAYTDTVRINNFASVIVNNLRAPDIIGVQEMTDDSGYLDNGVVVATLTPLGIINAIQAISPTLVYSYTEIAPVNNQDGGAPGLNIRPGFFWRTDRVQYAPRTEAGSPQTTPVSILPPDPTGTGPRLSRNPGRISPTDPSWTASRKPLAGEFIFNGTRLIVVANHFTSKSGDDRLFGPFQPPITPRDPDRARQAELVNAFVQSAIAADANARVVVLGDLNDFQFSGTLTPSLQLGNPPSTRALYNLMDTVLPANERYTYYFEGNAQILDHILVSPWLYTNASPEVDVVHVAGDFPRPYVDLLSDHAPVVARLSLPQLTVALSSGSYSVNENAGPAVVTATLSAPSALTVTVNLATSNGTAIAGTDYATVTTVLTFTPGVTQVAASIPITDNLFYNLDRTFTVTLSSPSGAALGAPATAIVTILNDDPLPTVQLSSGTYSVAENGGSAPITVTLSAASGVTATVVFSTVNGTALAGTHYTGVSTTVTFAPGVTQTVVSVGITDDLVFNLDRTFTVALSGPVSATLGTPATATVTIVNDDGAPTVQLSSGTYSVAENGGSVPITVTLSAASGVTATVVFSTANGTALAGTHYTGVSTTVTFAPGVTQTVVNVPIANDLVFNFDRTFTVTLSGPANATLGTPVTATVTIVNDDPLPTVQLSSGTYSVAENGGSVPITVTLSAASGVTATVVFSTANGTALAGTHYTGVSTTVTFAPGVTQTVVNVLVTNDSVFNANRTFTVALSGPANATLGTPATATVTIVNDDGLPTAQLSSGTYSVAENGGSAPITVTLSAASGVTATVVFSTANGTALAGTHYTGVSTTVTFAPGVTQTVVNVLVTNDSVFNANRTFTVALSGPANATLGTPATATVTIVNDDGAPTVQLSSGTYSVAENGGSVPITVTLSAASGVTATVVFSTANGTALAGTHYTGVSTTVTFAPGVTQTVVNVPIINDGVFGPNRTFTVTLSGPVNATLGTPATATVTINESSVQPQTPPNQIVIVSVWRQTPVP